MAQGIPILKDAPYNVLTVPNYVRSLVVTTKPAQVIAAYTAPPGVEAWTVYRPSAEGVPAHPYDGWRVVTPLSGDAETTVAVTLTEHIVNDTEYVVRVFIRGRLGFQTRVGGTVATATPVAGQNLRGFAQKTLLDICGQKMHVAHHGPPSTAYSGMTNGTIVISQNIYTRMAWGGNDYASCPMHIWLNNENSGYLSIFSAPARNQLLSVRIPYTKNQTVLSGESGLTCRGFLLSGTEVGGASRALNVEGADLGIFSSDADRDLGIAWSLRSPDTTSSTRHWRIDAGGALSILAGTDMVYGIRPALVFSSDMLFELTPNPDGSYSPIL